MFLFARIRPKGAGRHTPLRRVELGSTVYSVPDGSTARVKMKLHPRQLKRLPRRYEVKVEAFASASLGEGTHRRIPLDRPRLRLVGLH
jgi:hypothetical protein